MKNNKISSLKNSPKLKNYMNTFSRGTVENEHPPKVFIFISIDLVNSTSYKLTDQNWPNVFADFFGIVQDNFKKNIPNLQVWKYVGDEVLFFKEISDLNSLLKIPSNVFKQMELCQKKLHIQKPECKNILYLKATLWIAAVKNSSDTQNKNIPNVMPLLEESLHDYIGVDIDEGFRISKFSSQNKLVIDSKLSYILLKYKDLVNTLCDYNVEDRLKIVGYKKLKGIWNNRLYPIIWYHKSWANMDSMFLYDEYDSSEICSTLKESNFTTEPICKLSKILSELDLIDNKIKDILSIIASSDSNKIYSNPSISKLIELHCVAVCINPQTNKILIARRSENKGDNPSLWEFGCAKANKLKTIEESLKKEYKDDFGINIEIVLDKKRLENTQPIPLAVYSITKDNIESKGIIFLAKITDEEIEITRTSKHSETKWISEEDIDSFSSDAIPDFKDTLKKAFEFYKQYYNE